MLGHVPALVAHLMSRGGSLQHLVFTEGVTSLGLGPKSASVYQGVSEED